MKYLRETTSRSSEILALIRGRGANFTLFPCWFSLNNSETVKAVTLAFCSILQHFVGDIRAKFGIPNLPQSPDNGQNSDGVISDFRNSGQSLTK